MAPFSLSRLFKQKTKIPDTSTAPPERPELLPASATHYVNGNPLKPPFFTPKESGQTESESAPKESAMFGMGCFWGAERKFWEQEGVFVTAVGYAGGHRVNPTYEEVCSGVTGHNEVVLVLFDPALLSYQTLLTLFWEDHDPTQGMRQGNDVGTQYRSGIYAFSEAQLKQAITSKAVFQKRLTAKGYDAITTEIMKAPPFYYAEDYHQQYLAKVPNGYCGLGGTGVCYGALKSPQRSI